MRNSRLCKFDSIQGIDPSAMAGMREGLRCSIPGFTQMTKAQVEQLKSTLKDERRGHGLWQRKSGVASAKSAKRVAAATPKGV